MSAFKTRLRIEEEADPSPPATSRRRNGGGQPAPAPVRIALGDCHYPLLRLVAEQLGWRVVKDGEDFE